MATSTHNKYVSIPDWFSSSSSTPITSTEKPANITNVYYGGGSGGGTTGITEIPIDNKTIVWQDQVITVPIDNDKIIINTEGKITTSGTTGVWELRQLTDGTNYIYTTYPVVTQLGITMYAGTDGLDLGSIYDGLPIDNATIYWDLDENGNKILKAVGSSGGVADSVAWANVTGKPDWLLDGKIQYTEIEGIPDLSGFITKDYIDGKFVTFDLNETIDGIKTFTNGIKIGTSLINQSQNDVIYIDANLVVRGGITMYATGTVDIPSILDSLPVAGTESKGIASFDSSYFSVTNGKVTLLADNVGLNESELAEYLNTNNYAKKSDIPSLNGYATQSWVESKGYALNSDLMSLTTKVDDFLEGSDTDTIINKWLELEAFLSGLSESDNLATILSAKADKDYVDDTFVTLTTAQTITGEKNFTGGLKVNGSPIVYDSAKKYWKLEGDLLVTGGVTMYGSDSSFTPSTIMDAIAVDGTTISKDGGVLKVIGGTGGGVADSVAWANITGKPTWIGSSKPSYSYSEITGAISTTELQNYLTQNSYLNVTSGDNRYLQLSGGTLSSNSRSPLTLKSGSSENHSLLLFNRGIDYWGSIGFNAANYLIFKDTNGANYAIWHSGNDGSGSGLDADTLDGLHNGELKASILHSGGGSVIDANTIQFSDFSLRFYSGIPNTSTNLPTSSGYQNGLLVLPLHSNGSTAQIYLGVGKNPYFRSHHTYEWNEIAYKTDNVSSATKLQTARTLWGQSFDGTGNVSGNITGVGRIYDNLSYSVYDSGDTWQAYGDGSKVSVFQGNSLHFKIGSQTKVKVSATGNLIVGDSDDYYKLSVGGTGYFASAPSDHILLRLNNNGTSNTVMMDLMINGMRKASVGYNGIYSFFINRTSTNFFALYDNGNAVFNNGNVGIGTLTPTTKFDINGKSMEIGTSIYGSGGVGSEIYMSTHREGSTLCARGMRMYVSGSATGVFQSFSIDAKNYGTLSNIMSINSSGNLLVTGGVTMYSDQRKKTILNHVELSLKQIAEAPLIEHYYNSDDKKTTHVGSIAQYWASMNDWFCKLDSEGYYTMEIQNAALASAISIARELDRYETKTDKAIKKLKKRICELEEEVERLKAS